VVGKGPQAFPVKNLLHLLGRSMNQQELALRPCNTYVRSARYVRTWLLEGPASIRTCPVGPAGRNPERRGGPFRGSARRAAPGSDGPVPRAPYRTYDPSSKGFKVRLYFSFEAFWWT
jgi:hypothetical protein